MSLQLLAVISDTSYLTEGISSPGQWDRATYLEGINWALQEAARLSRATFNVWAALTCPTNDNRLTLSTPPLEVLGVRSPTMAKNLLKTDEATEKSLNPGWRYLAGTPTAWFEEAGNIVRLNRMVAASTNFDVEVLEPPAALVNDTDLLDARFPDYMQRAIRFGAAAFLLTQAGDQQDFAKAQACMNQFEELITGRKAQPPQQQ